VTGSANVQAATSDYGKAAKAKLASAAVTGQPEDQLRGLNSADIVLVGETALNELQVRPDFAVTVGGVLVGFVEVKAPGKGADPHRFTNQHDKSQWQKMSALPPAIHRRERVLVVD
jgi:hypothetical protein